MRHARGEDGVERLSGIEGDEIAKMLQTPDVQAVSGEHVLNRQAVFGRRNDQGRLVLPKSVSEKLRDDRDERLVVLVELDRVKASAVFVCRMCHSRPLNRGKFSVTKALRATQGIGSTSCYGTGSMRSRAPSSSSVMT